MSKITPKDIAVIKLAEKEGSDADLLLLDEITRIEERLEELKTLAKGERGEKGDPGRDGVDGRDGEDGRNGRDGKDGIDGQDGKDGEDGEQGLPGPIGQVGRDGSPDSPEQVRDKLENLQGDERLDKSAIKGLEDALKKREGSTYSVFGARLSVHTYDLTPQCNGVLKTFSVPTNFGIVGLFSTQFPVIYRPLIDYTTGNKTITLTSEVAAPEAGQTLIVQYIK